MKSYRVLFFWCLAIAVLWPGVSHLQAAPLTWVPGVMLNEPRSSAATVVAWNGSILIFGGNPLGSVDTLVYGGNNAQAITSTRIGPGAVALNNGMYFVYGGHRTNTTSGVLSSTLSYNPVSSGTDDPNVFSVASMTTARYYMAYALDASGYAYAIGGLGNNNAVLSSVERYDSVSNSWKTVAALPAARYLFNAIFDGTNIIYTFGGRTNATTGAETTTVLSYDVGGNTWTTLAPMPVATAGSAAIKGADGKFYIIGGTAGGVVTNLVQVYDPGANAWSLSTPLPAGVTVAGGQSDTTGHLVVMGGADTDGNDLVTTWVSQQLNQPDAAPVFTTTTLPTALYATPYTSSIVATGNPQPTYQLLTGPTSMTIDPYSGQLSWSPGPDQMGSNTVTVQASNFAGTTNKTYYINAVGPTPDIPANVVITNIGETSVTMMWDPVTPVVGDVTYTLYVRTVQYAGKGTTRAVYTAFASGITSTSVVISGLAAGSSHVYSVAAVAAGSQSGRSPDIGFTTLSPQPPTNLHITALTSTSVTLEWDAPTGPVPAATYEIWGWINNGVNSTVYATGVTDTTYTVTGLIPGSLHEWGVRDHDALGYVSAFDYGPTALNPVPTPAVLSADTLPTAEGFTFTVQGNAVETTFIQATTNPYDGSTWETIATNPPTSATFIFTDTNANQYPNRFYRVVSP